MTNLDELEALDKAATAGPWRWCGEYHQIQHGTTYDENDKQIPGTRFWNAIVETDSGHYPPELPDAVFIAAARNSLPALIAELRAAREVIGVARGSCNCEWGGFTECVHCADMTAALSAYDAAAGVKP